MSSELDTTGPERACRERSGNAAAGHPAVRGMVHMSKLVVVLLGLAAMAPAQFRIEGSIGRHVQVGVQVAAPRAPVLRAPAGHDHGHGRSHDRGRGWDRDDRSSRHGRWETVCEQVWVDGYWHEEHVPARYGWVTDHCGRRNWVMLEPARCQRTWVPGRYETRHRRVWVRC